MDHSHTTTELEATDFAVLALALNSSPVIIVYSMSYHLPQSQDSQCISNCLNSVFSVTTYLPHQSLHSLTFFGKGAYCYFCFVAFLTSRCTVHVNVD